MAGLRTSKPGVGLDGLDVRRVRALGALLGVVGDLRALGQRLEAAALDGGVVDEEVLALVVRGDEAEALLVAEPLHGSGCHVMFLRGRCVLRNAEGAGQQLRTLALLAPGFLPGRTSPILPGRAAKGRFS